MLTSKCPKSYSGNVFGFYSDAEEAKLAVQIAKNNRVSLIYDDGSNESPIKRFPTFRFNAADDKYVLYLLNFLAPKLALF